MTISDGLLGQIIVDDESVHAVVAEELAHGAAGVGGQVLERSSVRSGSRNDNAKRSKSKIRQNPSRFASTKFF